MFLILVVGAVLRYWLSTVVPFDAAEMEALARARVRDHGARTFFIMFNGLSLLALYLLVRRAAGVPAGLAALLLLQSSLAFQEQALRVRWSSIPLLLVMIGLTVWRHTRPPRRAPRKLAVWLAALAALLAARELYLVASLVTRMESIRSETRGDAEALYRSIVACGGGRVTPLATLRRCDLAWPEQRSLAQQEALLGHARMLPPGASILDGRAPLPEPKAAQVGVFDFGAAALFVVAEEEGDAVAGMLGPSFP